MNTDKGVALYQSEDGSLRIEARVSAESIWLTMAQIAELFGVKASNPPE